MYHLIVRAQIDLLEMLYCLLLAVIMVE